MTVQLDLPSAIRTGFAYIALAVAVGLLAYAPLSATGIALSLIAAGIVALIVPWLPWVALAGLLPFLAAVRIGAGTPADLLLALCLAVWFAAGTAQRSVLLNASPPVWAILIYLTAQTAALTTASDLGEGLVEVVKWGEFAAVLLILPSVLPARHVGWVVGGLLVAGAAQGLLGLYQFIFRIGPDWFLIQDRFMRASGTFRQPNPYAGFLGVSLPFALTGVLWTLERWWQTRTFGRLVQLVALAGASTAIGLGLIASWSRGGWLGAAAGVIVVMLLYSRVTRMISLAGAALGAVGLAMGTVNPAWVPQGVRARIADLPAYFGAGNIINQPVTDENFAVIERLAHWVAALRMWESNIWLGIGPGNYNAAYASVALPRWPDALGHAHNIYLNVLAETGVIGFLAFVLMWAALTGWIVHILRASTRDGASLTRGWVRLLGIGSLGMLAYLAVHSIFDNLFVQGIYLQIALWLGCLAAAAAVSSGRNTTSSESRVSG